MADSEQKNTKKSIGPAEIARRAREQAEALLGRQAEQVSSVERNGDDGWKVTLEVIELERIPPTTSLVGSYELELDGEGELQAYRRLRRYSLNQADPQQEQRE